MTKNEKALLLQDICSRLPHGIVVGTIDNDGTIPNFWMFDSYNSLTEDVRLTNCDVNADRLTYFGDVRPYLFPLSSMTEEQKEEFNTHSLKLQLQVINDEIMYEKATEFEVDFYNKHHLDWRGLIPMGLAIDATNLNIY